ncbi:MAG: phosphoribosyltransferase [Oscillospiraceae bacterium]|jgi:adenine/guanine phosphoribosyltransferase-like PRPP-binding protein|nr:phosphoribosyltransferase [Oscillospiraceae bacterium]
MTEKFQLPVEKLRALVRSYIKDEQFKGIKNIYGIPKGGIPFAVALANFSHLPLLLKASDITDDTLVVDDILDSGDTLLKFNNLRKAKDIHPVYGVIVTKINEFNLEARKLLTFQGYEVEGIDWVVFPWEDDKNVSKKLDGTEIE